MVTSLPSVVFCCRIRLVKSASALQDARLIAPLLPRLVTALIALGASESAQPIPENPQSYYSLLHAVAAQHYRRIQCPAAPLTIGAASSHL